MCFGYHTNELFACGHRIAPARCAAAKTRYREATTLHGKQTCYCPSPSDSPNGVATWTADVCPICWENNRKAMLEESGGGGKGKGKGNGKKTAK